MVLQRSLAGRGASRTRLSLGGGGRALIGGRRGGLREGRESEDGGQRQGEDETVVHNDFLQVWGGAFRLDFLAPLVARLWRA